MTKLSTTDLRGRLNGRVIEPGDAGYDAARTVFYGGIDKRPSLIVRAADESDVIQVIAHARDAGLELAVRSGGHSMAGHGVSEGGIVLHMGGMRSLDIDPANRTAWVQPGLTAGEYTTAANAHGLATGFGDSGLVGIGGITLGGGIGFLARKYGLTIDSLLAADIVTADGRLLRVDAENHPDLFWAMRGGGGNFGVVTRFQFRLQPVDHIYGGMLFLPATAQVIEGFISIAESAPEELSTIANILPLPPMPFVPPEHHGKLAMMSMLVYAGDPTAGERVAAPFRALTTPLADMLKPMRYPEIYPPEEGDYHPLAAGRTLFRDTFDRQAAELILDNLQSSRAMMPVTQLRVLGGAMARVPNETTAYAHRHRRIMGNVAALYQDLSEKDEHEAWAGRYATALHQGEPGAYVNFIGDEGAGRDREAYPAATWERLSAIKRRYDPHNVFRVNHNIPPA